MITPRWTLRRIRNVPDKSCRANKTTFYAQKLFSENHAVYDILWKKYGTTRQTTHDNMMLRRNHVFCMRVNYSDTRDAHLQYFIPIASYLINSFWSRKIFCGNSYKKWESSNHLSVITICCAKCVWIEHSSVTMQLVPLCKKTDVCFILATKALLYSTWYF